MAHAGNRTPATCCYSSAANTANSYRHKEGPSASKDHSHSTAGGRQTSCSGHNNKQGTKAGQKWQTSGQQRGGDVANGSSKPSSPPSTSVLQCDMVGERGRWAFTHTCFRGSTPRGKRSKPWPCHAVGTKVVISSRRGVLHATFWFPTDVATNATFSPKQMTAKKEPPHGGDKRTENTPLRRSSLCFSTPSSCSRASTAGRSDCAPGSLPKQSHSDWSWARCIGASLWPTKRGGECILAPIKAGSRLRHCLPGGILQIAPGKADSSPLYSLKNSKLLRRYNYLKSYLTLYRVLPTRFLPHGYRVLRQITTGSCRTATGSCDVWLQGPAARPQGPATLGYRVLPHAYRGSAARLQGPATHFYRVLPHAYRVLRRLSTGFCRTPTGSYDTRLQGSAAQPQGLVTHFYRVLPHAYRVLRPTSTGFCLTATGSWDICLQGSGAQLQGPATLVYRVLPHGYR
ncbi:hypothetical protein HaLaN_25599, partial [Haematococcus lacustris]